eukprot:TRINITY_DN1341_c0_g1_i7.p1 TRINITY_DN1341_c0_g1~~TRINITY_DN1341_c0_g1_i7.p1  ORF type:complete len:141 (-),score=37.53 TRINITY_DN1341_c0_g1_i7:447-869(-)
MCIRDRVREVLLEQECGRIDSQLLSRFFPPKYRSSPAIQMLAEHLENQREAGAQAAHDKINDWLYQCDPKVVSAEDATQILNQRHSTNQKSLAQEEQQAAELERTLSHLVHQLEEASQSRVLPDNLCHMSPELQECVNQE